MPVRTAFALLLLLLVASAPIAILGVAANPVAAGWQSSANKRLAAPAGLAYRTNTTLAPKSASGTAWSTVPATASTTNSRLGCTPNNGPADAVPAAT